MAEEDTMVGMNNNNDFRLEFQRMLKNLILIYLIFIVIFLKIYALNLKVKKILMSL